MFYLEKEVGWKERGSGMLKINVPVACVSFDDSGLPIPGSFDASGLENDEDPEAGGSTAHKVARLIMRQDQTHRILLNTVILPAMKFQEKTSLKSVGVMFTAFEGEEAKPVSVHMRVRMSPILDTESSTDIPIADECSQRQIVPQRSWHGSKRIVEQLSIIFLSCG